MYFCNSKVNLNLPSEYLDVLISAYKTDITLMYFLAPISTRSE